MARCQLSVVTVTYKDPAGLAATLKSLEPLQVAELDWENVIVDSSPELNRAAIEDARARGWPLRYLTAKPEGIYEAQNQGLALAQGHSLWFLNGGDRLKDIRTLLSALEVLRSDPALDLIACQNDLERDGNYKYRHAPPQSFLASIVGINRICHQAMIYRASVFERLGPFRTRYRVAADYEHLVRAYLSGFQVKSLDAALVVFDSSGTSNNPALAFDDFKRVHHDLASELPRWFNVANELVRPLEYGRVLGLKFFSRSPLAGVLRPLWHGFKRRQRRE